MYPIHFIKSKLDLDCILKNSPLITKVIKHFIN